jgi:hypothetical protein
VLWLVALLFLASFGGLLSFLVVPILFWRIVAFNFCIVNLLQAMWVSNIASFCVVGDEVGLITHMVESYVVLIGEAGLMTS